MTTVKRYANPERWLDQIFATRAAKWGAVLRCSVTWVDREVGRARFHAEIRACGYHLIQTADQYIVVCHDGPIRILF